MAKIVVRCGAEMWEIGEIQFEKPFVDARDAWVGLASLVLPTVMEKWPTDEVLAPQAILLLAARVLSAVIRGCDTEKLDAMGYDRDPLLENTIITASFRHFGLDYFHRLMGAMKTKRLMRTG
jgi:hypothetical protein